MAMAAGRAASPLEGRDPDWLVGLLRRMLLIRAFDSLLPQLYTQGLVRGSSHAAIGQEATAVGACAALRPDDLITSTHRGHGHTIAKGGDVTRMMSELLGRADGYCRGKGGSMHIADFSIGMLGANGIVGGGFGIAAGAALSAQMRGTGQVALCFFGDGAINQGAFLECGNLAAVWRLPLVLLCENNGFAMSKRPEQVTAVGRLADRASGLGIPGRTIDGMQVLEVHDAVAAAAGRARGGDGPSLVVAECYRMAGHFSGDVQNYRSKEEVEVAGRRDPIVLFRRELVGGGVLTDSACDELAGEAGALVHRALDHARAAPMPDPDEAWQDLYA
jgi:acetoin:2,6-dichlorophenolindophenol oxidoreductase subunit alpha